MTKILVIRQIFGQRLPKNWPDSEITKKLVIRQKIGHSPKNWSEIAKKLARLRDHQKIGHHSPKNWPDSEITKKLARLRDYQKIGLSFAKNLVIL